MVYNASMSEVKSLAELPNWGGGYPGEHEFSTLEGLENIDGQLDEAFAAARALLNNWRGNKFVGLNLFGNPGTGKTHFAIGLGRALHDAGADVAYQYVPSINTGAGFNTVGDWMAGNHNAKNQTPRNVFGRSNELSGSEYRNPMAALILDEYTPSRQREVAAAVEAAAQYGGMIILTSNFNDPYKLLDTPSGVPDTPVKLATDKLAQELDPEMYKAMKQQQLETSQILRESLRSRLLAGVKDIWFMGEDRRSKNTFWNSF